MVGITAAPRATRPAFRSTSSARARCSFAKSDRGGISSNPRGAAFRSTSSNKTQPRSFDDVRSVPGSVLGTIASVVVFLASPSPSISQPGQRPPPVAEMPGGCTLDALDLFKDTRAKFSLEVGTGALPEAVLDLAACDYSGADMDGRVLSGAIASNATFDNASFVGGEMSRAKSVNSSWKGANLSSTNFYEVNFAGSDLRGVNFDNAILTNARFGKDAEGKWADLDGVNWDGALLSSSDAQRVCENPTVDEYGRAILGCR